MNLLERTRLEKALADQGFDLPSALDGEWLVGRSTQHATAVWLRYEGNRTITLAAGGDGLRAALTKEGFACEEGGLLQGEAQWKLSCSGYDDFHRALGRLAKLARCLPNQVALRFVDATRNLPKTTEAERLVVKRIGQEMFREALVDYWQGRCPVTGLDLLPLLRASHIKPWAECDNDNERLDVFNGLLLAPHLDALFDKGLITFSDDGRMIRSGVLTDTRMHCLGIDERLIRRVPLVDRHLKYLAWHRTWVFRG